MREMFTTEEARARELTHHALQWGVKTGKWVVAARNVYALGSATLSLLDKSIAGALATKGAVSGSAAAEVLGGLDLACVTKVDFTIPSKASNKRSGARRTRLVGSIIEVNGIQVTDGLQTLVDLAGQLDDKHWEHALEAALRKRLTTIAAIEVALPTLSARRQRGATRIRRVLAMRPVDAPPTESLLETYAVQLIRDAGLPTPTRQFVVRTADDRFVARVDLCWPELGVFLELDGRGHDGQPVYDAVRQTAVVGAKGWLCIRATWRQVVNNPKPAARDFAAVLEQAGRRVFTA
jgi:very-short-patch-repair endonuclease